MRLVTGVSLAVLLSGCATRIGAQVMPEVRFHYNEAVAISSNEQILLNLVRIRFNHTVQFLEPTNVVTSWSIERSAGASVGGNLNVVGGVSPLFTPGLSALVSATETPTITYQPLSGEDFVRQLAQPVGPEMVLRLIQSGWSADLVLELTTERLNGLLAPAFSGRADHDDFRSVLEALAALQRASQLDVELRASGALLHLAPTEEARELLALLHIPEDTTRLRVTDAIADREPDQLALRTRSLLSTLSYASQGVEVPVDDPTATPLPASEALPYLQIHSGPTDPGREAYIRLPYRGRWYWIADADLASKRTFSLLALLFGLMSAPDVSSSPVLTLPAGG